MENEKKYFEELLTKSSIEVNDETKGKMLNFLELLYEKNQVMNLTAIRDKEGMLEKHFIDSLLLTKVIKDEEKSFIDPEKNFLLVDSVRKKIEFINEVIEKLGLENMKTSFERAEELIKGKRETFDAALCRGVANLRIILEYMIPFIKINGRFLPQKLNLNEVEESGNALKLLGSTIEEIHKFNLPKCGDERIILEIVKNKKTHEKYPRKTGIPAKKPL